MEISYEKSLEATYYELDVLTHAVFAAQVGRLSESVYRGHVTEPAFFHSTKNHSSLNPDRARVMTIKTIQIIVEFVGAWLQAHMCRQ